jgi:glycine/D-amino acid oxidase-like deaminating enzyme/nitrite reductase/ring-hydroxylating ferredoxin subunit
VRADRLGHGDDGQSVSLWMAESAPRTAPLLTGALEADVCVVGAGIAGLSTAYCAARAGLSVVVVDDGPIAGGQTKRTTAHLASAIDDRFTALERVHGAAGARAAAASHAAAIDRIESIVAEEGIDCGFERVDGYLCLAGDATPAWLDRELAAAQRAGLDVTVVRHSPVETLEGPCLRFARQAQLHPLRYAFGLADAAARRGGRIFGGTHVDTIEPRADGRIRVRSNASGASVDARFAVVATNAPIHERVAVHTKEVPHRTYAMAFALRAGAIPRALYWDTLDPYHYVRIQPGRDRDVLIAGGEDHRIGALTAGAAAVRYERLEDWTRRHFPVIEAELHRWSGEILETLDGLAFIGPTPSGPGNVLMASGDSGMGLTHGTIAGMLLTDLVLGRENPWARWYDPARRPLAAAPHYVSENVETAIAYADWLKVEGGDPHALLPGTGGVFGWGIHRRAVYCDLDGKLHVRSAVCPHLGGLVGWNDAEKTWDCPCHGSRFDRYGRVVQGPANADLEESS